MGQAGYTVMRRDSLSDRLSSSMGCATVSERQPVICPVVFYYEHGTTACRPNYLSICPGVLASFSMTNHRGESSILSQRRIVLGRTIQMYGIVCLKIVTAPSVNFFKFQLRGNFFSNNLLFVMCVAYWHCSSGVHI